ncbi:hypothetical protein WAI453_002672 [Rhynchosporium graminicola]
MSLYNKRFRSRPIPPSFATLYRRLYPHNPFDASVSEEDLEVIPEVSGTNISSISTSAYEQPKTPKTFQNKKSKNIILTPVASPSPSKSDILSPVSYRSPSPFSPSSDLSESLWIKDPFKSKFHAVRADESCDCSKCDAALDADVSCSITMYSAESDEESVVMDDSSLIPILEPCIAFNFIPSTVEPVPSTSSIPSSFTVPGAFPILDAEVEDDSGASWVPSAVALGVAVVGMAVAWFWVPYKVWRSRSRMGVMAQGS